jgi:hypothetical protein
MPTPTIPAGNLFMNATTYTGTSATQTITNGVAGQAFQPDLVWMKARNNGNYHWLTNSVTGTGEYLSSNDTIAARTGVTDALTAFSSNGFTLGANTSDAYVAAGVNYTGRTYVGWQWKGGGTAVSNTAGTITSQVSANTTSGFSVVTYTGTGANATVGHGLGVAPQMVIVKRRDSGVGATNWFVYHRYLNGGTNPAQYYLQLQSTNNQGGASSIWNDIAPTTSAPYVFSVGTSSETNGSGGTFVAYCWAPIDGYSAFGSYTGNGDPNGPFVYTGFRPRWVMWKNRTTGSQWILLDTSINTYNVSNAYLEPNTSDTENTANTVCDILSNGFKLRNAGGTDYNASGEFYIYAAFAENPFKYANAR